MELKLLILLILKNKIKWVKHSLLLVRREINCTLHWGAQWHRCTHPYKVLGEHSIAPASFEFGKLSFLPANRRVPLMASVGGATTAATAAGVVEWHQRPQNPKNPIVFFDITIGTIPAGRVRMELFADIAPKTAENFRYIYSLPF